MPVDMDENSCLREIDEDIFAGKWTNELRNLIYKAAELQEKGIEVPCFKFDYAMDSSQKVAYFTMPEYFYEGDDDVTQYYTLWVTYYKNRQRTEQILLLNQDGATPATQEQIEQIVLYFSARWESLRESTIRSIG